MNVLWAGLQRKPVSPKREKTTIMLVQFSKPEPQIIKEGPELEYIDVLGFGELITLNDAPVPKLR
eukprot:3252895-Karenia_brevis.AAC.1